jgi:MraZ protein
MPEDVANELSYTSVYRHSVDEKRRVPVPFRWRPKGGVEFTIIVWAQHQAGTCLRVLPPAQWAKLGADIGAMPNNDAKQTLKRRIGSLAIQAKLDGSGRIAIPEDMAAAAAIISQAVLVGMLDRFEIWSPERYEKVEGLDNAHLQDALKMVG